MLVKLVGEPVAQGVELAGRDFVGDGGVVAQGTVEILDRQEIAEGVAGEVAEAAH